MPTRKAILARVKGRLLGVLNGRGLLAQLMAAQAATALGSFIVNIISARGMGPEGRGSLAFYLQLGYVVSTLCIAGVDRALPVAKRPGNSLNETEGAMIRLLAPSLVLTLVGVACWSLFADHEGDRGILAVAFMLAMWGNVSVLALRTAAITSQRAGRFLVVVIASQLALISGASMLLVLTVESSIAWLFLYGVTYLLPVAVAFGVAVPRTASDGSERESVRRLGLRLMPTLVANMVMLRLDRLLLPIMAGAGQLGLYIVVAAITELTAWPVQSYVDSKAPVWRRDIEARTLRPSKTLLAVAVYAVAVALVLGFALDILLVPVFGSEFSQSLSLIWPLAGAAGLYAVSRVGMGLSIAKGLSSQAAAIDITSMVVGVVAYLALIPMYGAMGAALGSLLAYGVGAVITVCLVLGAGLRPRSRVGWTYSRG